MTDERLCKFRKCRAPLQKGWGLDFCNDMHRVQERALEYADAKRLQRKGIVETAEKIFVDEITK